MTPMMNTFLAASGGARTLDIRSRARLRAK